jgi:hypothetical protein
MLCHVSERVTSVGAYAFGPFTLPQHSSADFVLTVSFRLCLWCLARRYVLTDHGVAGWTRIVGLDRSWETCIERCCKPTGTLFVTVTQSRRLPTLVLRLQLR